MPDLICPLLALPDNTALLASLQGEGITIRHARHWERTPLHDFIQTTFGAGWAGEAMASFSRNPISTIVAVEDKRFIGFATYEGTAPGYFGPTGVLETYRGRGIGKALFLEAMAGLRDLGYVYGIVGDPGPIAFYQKILPGILLPAEWPTIYTGVL